MKKEKTSIEDFGNMLIDHINAINNKNGIHEKIVLKSIIKGNDTEKRAICIESTDSKRSMNPVVYIDNIYDDYEAKNFDDIVTDIYRILHGNDENQVESDVYEKITREGVKNSVTFRIVNKAMNKKYLENKIFRDYLDLAIIYQIRVSLGDDHGQVVVTKSLAEQLGYTEEEFFDMAMTNTPEIYPVQDLGLFEAVGFDMPEDESPMPRDFRVISNTDKIFGASVILYPGYADELYKEYGNKYILPSSLHEVLLVDYNADPKDYLKMVKDVNNTFVDKEDILSDSVYELTSEGISIAAYAA